MSACFVHERASRTGIGWPGARGWSPKTRIGSDDIEIRMMSREGGAIGLVQPTPFLTLSREPYVVPQNNLTDPGANPTEAETMHHAPVRSPRGFAMLATLTFLVLGCASDSPTATDEPVDPAGVWTFGIVVTQANGVCDGEEGESSVYPITITKSGSAPPYQISARGFGGDSLNVLTGTFDAGNRLVISGSYLEDGGTTTPMHDLVATGADRMEGTETWNWTGPGGSCPGSQSLVTADRI